MDAVLAFDLDHTLVRSSLDLAAMRVDIRALAVREGVPLPPASARWTVAQTIAGIAAAIPELESVAWEIAAEHEVRALADAACEPGALEAVTELAEAGAALAVWTNNMRGATEVALERCGLRGFFPILVTRDEAALKPDPDGLRLVRQAHPTWPIWMIGDSWVDGAAAQAGGVPFIAYGTDPEVLRQREVIPRLIIGDLRMLPAHLATLTGP
jgi:phosphoglycolate phosphatase